MSDVERTHHIGDDDRDDAHAPEWKLAFIENLGLAVLVRCERSAVALCPATMRTVLHADDLQLQSDRPRQGRAARQRTTFVSSGLETRSIAPPIPLT